MKRVILLLVLVGSLSLMGCSGKFWGGAAGGVLGAGASYEYNADKEMKRIDEALSIGEITQEEYDIRKDQIKRMSVIK